MRLHEKHRGHEQMHAEMILILFATLVISQIALVKWRQVYPNSYHVSEKKPRSDFITVFFDKNCKYIKFIILDRKFDLVRVARKLFINGFKWHKMTRNCLKIQSSAKYDPNAFSKSH